MGKENSGGLDGKVYIGEYVDDKKEGVGFLSGLMGNGMKASGKTENSMELASTSLATKYIVGGTWIDGKKNAGKLQNQY